MLSACGTVDSKKNPRDTDYILVSKGSASLIYKAFVGGVEYCKVTKHGIPHVDFVGTIVYEGDSCRVEIKAGSDVPR